MIRLQNDDDLGSLGKFPDLETLQKEELGCPVSGHGHGPEELQMTEGWWGRATFKGK